MLNQNLKQKLINLFKDQQGMSMVEYAVAGAIIAAAVSESAMTIGYSIRGAIFNIVALLN